jgi:hypothetical protein
MVNAEADPAEMRGRLLLAGKWAMRAPVDSAGVLTMACTKEEDSGNTGSPATWPCARPTGAA